jgi:hypothetical protein
VISGPKIFLEMILLIGVIIVLYKEGWKIANVKLLYIITSVSIVFNILFYIFAAWPLYVSYGKQTGVANQTLYCMVIFDILKWFLLIYFITRFALKVENKINGGGFAITKNIRTLIKIIPIGIITGMAMSLIVYGIMYLSFRDEFIQRLIEMGKNDLYLKLGLWGGVRNLVGEEVLTRLGVQTLILYFVRKKYTGVILSVLLSSLFFEFWHNGFQDIYFFNFTGSFIFALVYYKYGYESAAIGHCVADWIMLCLFPYVIL